MAITALKKADMIALLSEQWTKEKWTDRKSKISYNQTRPDAKHWWEW